MTDARYGRNCSLRLIVVGAVKEEYYRNKIKEYVQSIRKRQEIDLIELRDESIPQKAGDSILDSIKEREGMRIMEHITPQDYVIALCIDGRAATGDTLRKNMVKARERGARSVTLVIGGSLGLSEAVIKRADYRLSFSQMTFPHQLMRVMLLEQLMQVICDK